MAEVSTRILRLDQARPPLPVDADRSRVRESHSPTVLGADTATVGTIGLAGALILTALETELAGQLLVSHEEPGQRAFRVAAGASVSLLPTLAQSDAELKMAVTEASLDQVHAEVDAQAKLNSELHGKVIPMPARFVFEPKLISTLDPSLLNTEDVRIGAGIGAYRGSTVRLRSPAPAGYCTSYWYADWPDTVTL